MEIPIPAIPASDHDFDDFVTVQHIPNSHPSRYIVQIRRYRADEKTHTVSQSSEPMGRNEAKMLSRKWAHWHRLEVR